jgi:hypothetical protein
MENENERNKVSFRETPTMYESSDDSQHTVAECACPDPNEADEEDDNEKIITATITFDLTLDQTGKVISTSEGQIVSESEFVDRTGAELSLFESSSETTKNGASERASHKSTGNFCSLQLKLSSVDLTAPKLIHNFLKFDFILGIQDVIKLSLKNWVFNSSFRFLITLKRSEGLMDLYLK